MLYSIKILDFYDLDRVRTEYLYIRIDLLRTESTKRLVLLSYKLYYNYE